ncbi:hypothetical protein BJX70DRAFT_366852 [Aspergillus crustosus]
MIETEMTQSHLNHEALQSESFDTEMIDADTTRGFPSSHPNLPPRPSSSTHFQAYTAATVVSAAGEKFLNSFWKRTRPDMQHSCPNCAPEPPPHQTIPQPEHPTCQQHVHCPVHGHQASQQHAHCPVHELPALPETPTEESSNPVHTQQDEYAAFAAREAELLQQIEQLQTNLANAPSADSVRAVERSLQAEIGLREKAQQEVRQKNSDLDVLRKRWKQAARELDKSRSQNQGFYQVTDNYLIELTSRLRYNVRNFAIQYFSGEVKMKTRLKPENKPKLWDTYMGATTPVPQDCELFLLSDRRPSVIQAFLWRFLVGAIFDNFRWAGETGISLRNMCRSLRPDGQYANATTPIIPDEERRFQMWLASTTVLVLDAGSAPSKAKETASDVDRKIKSLVENVRDVIDNFAVLTDPGYTQELTRIIEEAVQLDIEICRQVARIEWVFPPPGKEVAFDSEVMRLDNQETASKDKGAEKQSVQLVMCPAMKKRGKSTGDEFGAPATLLVPMEVSCQAVGGDFEARGRKAFV